jgi:hypothetical protein
MAASTRLRVNEHSKMGSALAAGKELIYKHKCWALWNTEEQAASQLAARSLSLGGAYRRRLQALAPSTLKNAHSGLPALHFDLLFGRRLSLSPSCTIHYYEWASICPMF